MKGIKNMTTLIYTFDNNEKKPSGPGDPPRQNMGQLEVHVQSKTGQNLSGAAVQIVRMRDNNLMYDLTTDGSGKTKRVSLFTPASPTSYGQNSVVPYANYEITLNLPGYYTTIYDHVSVYDGSTMVLYLVLYPARI